MSKILYVILAAGMIGLCGYLLSADSIKLPSRYGSSFSIVESPVTYFLATLPLAFGLSIILYLIDREKYKMHCEIIVSSGVVLFFIGVVIITPLLKTI